MSIPPRSINRWRVIAVIPARNEEATIIASLQSIATAIEHCGPHIAEAVIVTVADNCTDATESLVQSFASSRSDSVLVQTAQGRVGTARAIGVGAGVARLNDAQPWSTWICNTDADTMVPRDWISRQLHYADRGAQALAGVVDVVDFDGQSPVVENRFRSSYTDLLPNDGSDHPHVHGANMGIRLDAYRAVGGWAPLGLSEDHEIWNRMRARGVTMAAPVELRVITSGRAVSRCAGGFADSLRRHAS